jgi:hypothetical protein
MKTSPVPGPSGSAAIKVDAARTIDFMGEGARVELDHPATTLLAQTATHFRLPGRPA